MSRISLYIISVIVAAFTLAACSEDVTEQNTDPDVPTGNVRLNINADPISGTDALSRAAETQIGSTGENIKSWFVVVADADGTIKQIIESENKYNDTSESTPEITEDTRYLNLEKGTYTFYGFANVSKESVLGDKGVNSTLDSDFKDAVYNFEGNKPLRAESDTLQSASQLFPKGIPMSCKQEVTIDESTDIVSLSLIRMVAKIQISVRNPTQNTVYVDSITIRHITRDNVDNVRLFPNDKVDQTTGVRDVNLVSYTDTTKQLHYTYIVPTSIKESIGGTPENYVFYVNESHVPDEHPFEVAVSRHTVDNGSVVSSTLRFNEVSNWFSIGRNELHVLSANLDRYRIDITAYPYTAIGVMPVYSNDAQMLTLTLNQYGHYDIVPRITDTHSSDSTYYNLYNDVVYQNVTLRHYVVNGRNHTVGYNNENTGFKIDSVKVNVESNSGWYEPNATSGTQHLPVIGWNSTAMIPRIECITGNYDGTSDVIITAYVTINDKDLVTVADATLPQNIVITRRMRIRNRYIDLSQLAKPRWRH